MEFLNPTALYGLFALPLLLLPYLIRRKPRRFVFSAILLLDSAERRAGRGPWGRLRLPPAFFLQLLFLLLLFLAWSEPVFTVRPSRIAIVLDNSASMQTFEIGKTRFDLAKEKARALLGELDLHARVDLYRTVPRVERARAASMTLSEAETVLAAMDPYDLGESPLDLNQIVNQMMPEAKYDRIYFLTDHPGRSETGMARVISVGQPKDNLALSSLQVNRSSLVDSQWVAKAEVQNFSHKDQKLKIILRGAETTIASRELAVPQGKSGTAIFERIPALPYYEAVIENRDALPLDNRRVAVAPQFKNLRILAVTPRPQALASLRNILGVTLDIISPAEYEKAERSGYGLEIFHFSTPTTLPQTATLFVLPPSASTLVDLEGSISPVVVSSWREPHALTRYINFALFRPTFGRALKPNIPGETIIEGPEGALVFAAYRQGIPYLVLGFDPFPYLGRANLPMSIFTLNILEWFYASASPRDRTTGDSLTFNRARQGEQVITPKGERVSLTADSNSFSSTFYQGIYQLTRLGGETQLFAVNFEDTNESDLRTSAPWELSREVSTKKGDSALFASWPYWLFASLLLVIIEWFIVPRWVPIKSWMQGTTSS
jgi:hypothetical protein